MSIESTFADWLEDNVVSLVGGTNLFVSSIFPNDNEGVLVFLNRRKSCWNEFERVVIQLLLYYRDYVEGTGIRDDIITALAPYRGTTGAAGSFGVTDEIYDEFLGIDDLNRNIFSVIVEIAYKEA